VGNDTIGRMGAKMLLNVQALKPVRVHVEVEPEDDVPGLIHRNLPTLRAVLDESDIIIEVIDARDPQPFRSLHLEELIASKPEKRMLLILNKIGGSFYTVPCSCLQYRIPDTCPRESIEAWAAYLRTQHPTLLCRSATAFLPPRPDMKVHPTGKWKIKVPVDDGLGIDSVLAYLSGQARTKSDGKPLAVAVLGLTNVRFLHCRHANSDRLIASRATRLAKVHSSIPFFENLFSPSTRWKRRQEAHRRRKLHRKPCWRSAVNKSD
jgi:nuclear GTP-binding protein